MHLDRELKRAAEQIPRLRVTVVPTLTSLAIHAGLLGLITAVTITVVSHPDEDDRPIGEVEIDLGPPQNRAATPTPQTQHTPQHAGTPRPQDSPAQAAISAGQATSAATNVAAPELPEAPPVRTPTLAAPITAPTITARSTAAAPAVVFAGLSSRAAQRIVYVVDASGAMASSLTFVLDRLATSIEKLRPTQQFQIILLGEPEGGSLRTPSDLGVMPRATAQNRESVALWLDEVTAQGKSNPLEGLKEAIKLQPDVVFLLSRSIQRSGPNASWGAGKEETLAELNALNPLDPKTGLRRVTIKAIQFIDEDPTGLMEAIGLSHGDGQGSYRLLTLIELGQPEPEPVARPVDTSIEAAIARTGRALAEVQSDGSMLSVLLGIPTAAERDRVQRTAGLMLTNLRNAPPPTRGMADVRAPLLRAQAELLLAATTEAPRVHGVNVLSELEPIQPIEPEQAGMRLIALAQGRSLLGQRGDAVRDLEELIVEANDLTLSPETMAQARFTLAVLCAQNGSDQTPRLLDEVSGSPPFWDSTTRKGDPLWCRLRAEVVAHVHDLTGAGPAEQVAPLLAYIDDAGTGLPVPTRRAIGAQRIRALVESRSWAPMNLSQAPARVVLLVAESFAADAGSLEDALVWAEAASRRFDDPGIGADAIWFSAGLLLEAGRREEAADRFARLVREHPSDMRAPDAGALTVQNTSEDHRTAVLAWALSSFPEHPQADAWRLERAGRIGGRGAIDLLRAIDPEGPFAVEASRLELTILDGLLAAGSPDESQMLARAAELAQRVGEQSAPERRIRLAESRLPDAPLTALRTAESLRDDAGSIEGGGARVDMLRARALVRLGRSEEAEPLLAGIADARARAGQYDEMFWAATTLRLELVEKLGDESAARMVRQHVVRLSLIDPKLGGNPWFGRLRALLPAETTARSAPVEE